MKMFDFMQTAVRFAVCIPLLAGMLAGCAAGDGSTGGGLTRYAGADVSYTAKFADVGTAECVRSGGTTVLRMTAPEHLCGVAVTYDGSACRLAAGEMEILLSPELAAGLTELFDLLARPMEDGGLPSRSADGERTVVTFDTGSVTLGGDGVPVEAAYNGRIIKIADFVIQ